MKETIYTIPILESFEEKGECPFCSMLHKIEQDCLEFVLGASASYMEDDVRASTDEKGFCKMHSEKMYQYQNRLGLAMITQTRLKKVLEDLTTISSKIQLEKKAFSLFAKKSESALQPLHNFLTVQTSTCYLCEKEQYTFSRYIKNFFYLYSQQHDVVQKLRECNGFCLPHFQILLQEGEQLLKQEQYHTFVETILPIQKNNLQRLYEELDWFIDKFDYRYRDEPWKNSEDALPRTLQKLSATNTNE